MGILSFWDNIHLSVSAYHVFSFVTGIPHSAQYFPGFPSRKPLSHLSSPCFSEGAHPPTHPLPPHPSTIPLHWGIKSPQDQGPPLPLMPDKAPSASLVLPLTSPLASLCSVQWLAVSIHICIGQDLEDPLRRQLYQAPVSKHFLASAIVFGVGVSMWI